MIKVQWSSVLLVFPRGSQAEEEMEGVEAEEHIKTCNYWEIPRGSITTERPDCLLWQNAEMGRVVTLGRLEEHISQHPCVEVGVWVGYLVQVGNWMRV